jgi:ABC-type transport system involved in cytochrome c biogenesis permease subunit
LSPVEYAAFWITVFAYALGTALALCGLIFNRERWLAAAGVVCGIGLFTHLVAVGARIEHTGHLPVASRYENVLMGAAVVMLSAWSRYSGGEASRPCSSLRRRLRC